MFDTDGHVIKCLDSKLLYLMYDSHIVYYNFQKSYFSEFSDILLQGHFQMIILICMEMNVSTPAVISILLFQEDSQQAWTIVKATHSESKYLCGTSVILFVPHFAKQNHKKDRRCYHSIIILSVCFQKCLFVLSL